MSTSAAGLRRASPPAAAATGEDATIFSAFTITATFWLLLTTTVGLLLSFKFTYPDLATNPYFSFGRLRAIHTNGTFYGWASVALTGLAMYVAARSSGVGLQQKRLAWAALWSYNIAVILGTITLDLGISNGSQEYREWVWWVAAFFLLAVVLSGIVVVATVMARSDREIYIANWYTIGAFIFTTILGITAAIPFYQYGLGQVAVQGFYMHNAVGMWFTFLSLGVIYYALPKLLNRPIYSYSLGVLGFWTNLVFYPVIGAHHYEFSPYRGGFRRLRSCSVSGCSCRCGPAAAISGSRCVAAGRRCADRMRCGIEFLTPERHPQIDPLAARGFSYHLRPLQLVAATS